MRLCFLYRGKLAAHVDRELGPWWSARVEGHLAGCDRCHIEVAALRRLDQALLVEDFELGDADGQRLLARLHTALDRPATMRSLGPIEAARPRSWALPALASGLAMGACLMIVMSSGLDRTKESGKMSVREQVAVAPAARDENESAYADAQAKGAGALAKVDGATPATSAAPPTGALATSPAKPGPEIAAAGAPSAPLPLDALTAEMDRLMMRVEKTGTEVTTTVARARQVALDRGREVAALPVEEDPWAPY